MGLSEPLDRARASPRRDRHRLEQLRERRELPRAYLRRLDSVTARARASAAEALGLIGDARATDALIGTLRDTNPYTRAEAAKALGLIGDARAVDELIGTLRDTNSYARGQAALALGLIGETRAVGDLVAFVHRGLHEADIGKCNYGDQALRLLGDAGGLRFLDMLRRSADWHFLEAQIAWDSYDAAAAAYSTELEEYDQDYIGPHYWHPGHPPAQPGFPRPDRDECMRRYGSCPLCADGGAREI